MSEVSRLVLGTVQLGMSYGIANQIGKPSREMAQEILQVAKRQGVHWIDTADNYGDSSEVLRECDVRAFDVLSKFVVPATGDFDFLKTLKTSLTRLGLERLSAYSFHQFSQLHQFAHWDQVEAAISEGLVQMLGVSVYDNQELQAAIDHPRVKLIQMPFNVFDNWGRRGQLIQQAQQRAKIIHCRSIFLQGLLLMDPERLPVKLQSMAPSLRALHLIAKDADRKVSELCVSYALARTEIDGLVLGVETAQQLQENIENFRQPKLDKDILLRLDGLKVAEPRLLSPAAWK